MYDVACRFSQSMLGVRQCRGTMGRLDTHRMLSVSSTTDQMLITLAKRYVLPSTVNILIWGLKYGIRSLTSELKLEVVDKD